MERHLDKETPLLLLSNSTTNMNITDSQELVYMLEYERTKSVLFLFLFNLFIVTVTMIGFNLVRTIRGDDKKTKRGSNNRTSRVNESKFLSTFILDSQTTDMLGSV